MYLCTIKILIKIPYMYLTIGAKIEAVKRCSTESMVVASKETGLEVNVDKTMYMVMSQDQDVGRTLITFPVKEWEG
jgi:hypothetical protein